jgi:hypothetical protein
VKNLPDILLRLFVAGALVVGGVVILRSGSAGSIVTCKPTQLKTASCTITERFAFSQEIIEEKTIDNIAQGKVVIINAPQDESEDVQFFRVLGATKKGVSYQIGKDEKNAAKAEAIASQINFLIHNPDSKPIELDYSSNAMNWLGWGAIGLGAIVSVVRTQG